MGKEIVIQVQEDPGRITQRNTSKHRVIKTDKKLEKTKILKANRKSNKYYKRNLIIHLIFSHMKPFQTSEGGKSCLVMKGRTTIQNTEDGPKMAEGNSGVDHFPHTIKRSFEC